MWSRVTGLASWPRSGYGRGMNPLRDETTHAETARAIEHVFESEIVPLLFEYIAIPNKSPLFDPDWDANGHMERAVQLVADWCGARAVPGLSLEIVRLEGRTPLILIEVPGAVDDTVLLYGHLDKQPEMEGWAEGLGPWEPVRRGERLYGRGGADDGYAAFASTLALECLAGAGVGHARCVVLIEACEESGSPDLPFYIEHLADRIGTPSLVVCLDSGCGDYERLWGTTSLRGMVTGELSVEILEEGVHSGDAGGVVPSSFRILRQLLSRLEDERTGAITAASVQAEIPPDRIDQAERAAGILGEQMAARFPFVSGCGRARRGRPRARCCSAPGDPPSRSRGSVACPRSGTPATCCARRRGPSFSLRLPPTVDGDRATREVKALLETDPPHGARVEFTPEGTGDGLERAADGAVLETAIEAASPGLVPGAGRVHGRRRDDSVHGHAGRTVPRGAVPDHGRPGPGIERARPDEFSISRPPRGSRAASAQILAAHAARG